VGDADAIGSPIIQESKAEERRRETVVYGRVYIAPCGSSVAYGPSVKAKCQLPIVNRP
jgi:hypothetical protein